MKLYEIISETFGVNKSDISDSMVFLELDGWDSMAHMMFIANLEEEYSIDFKGDDIVDVTNVKELKELLKEYNVSEL